MNQAQAVLGEVIAAFDFGGENVSAQPFGCGHVNDTFLIRGNDADGNRPGYVLQRLSPEAFKHPEELMRNVIGISEYLCTKIRAGGGDCSREALEFIRPRSGELFYTDSTGCAWRSYRYIDGVRCYQSADTPELFAASGRAFGHFQKMLEEYPAQTLFETIPHFHDTEDRLAKLKAAIAEDKLGRAAGCAREISFALERAADCSVAMRAMRDGILPLRVTHNDTKLNNVLFDEESGEAVCVIDLDTVMPGLSIFDFGDSIRFGANHCAEDEKDLSLMSLDLELYAAYAAAFVEGAGGALTEAEIDYLPWGAKLMTLECGIRFLTDHLSGDTYFHISREGQNLDRCRTQFKLVEDMENRWNEMNAVTAGLK